MYVCVTPTPLKPGALTEPAMMGCGKESGPVLRRETTRKLSCKTRNTGQLEQPFQRKINHNADGAFTGKAFFCIFAHHVSLMIRV